MKKLSFLLTDSTPVKGPYSFAELCQKWTAGEITPQTKLFVTERDEENKVRCSNLRAEQIQKHLEDGTEINMDELC